MIENLLIVSRVSLWDKLKEHVACIEIQGLEDLIR